MGKKKKLKYKKNYFEKKAWENNLFTCGIDEAGRGAFAGPLVAAAAILPIGKKHRLLKDSKQLTEEERTLAFHWINKHCLYSYAIVSNIVIDRINIYQATILAMQKAFYQIQQQTQYPTQKLAYLLIDSIPLQIPIHHKNENLKIISMNYGETISTTIAAASIVAKVIRDSLLKKLDPLFPFYNFSKNKGYGTHKHQQAIEKFGLSPIHRQTFIPKNKKRGPDAKKRERQLLLL